jgi:hypothetical protein
MQPTASAKRPKLSRIHRALDIRRVTRALSDTRANMATLDSPGLPADPLLPRGVERVVLRLFGRPITCAACGRRLFVGLPLAFRGKVWLIGAYNEVVHVSFVSSERMEFRHAHLDGCAAPERPWAS